MTRLFTAPRTRPLPPALARLSALVPAAPRAVPGPSESPVGPDVEDVAPGEIIESSWGISVAEDLAEIHAKLATVETGGVDSVNSRTGAVVLTKSDVGLSNVDNTSDVNKPLSTATTTALGFKADKTTTITPTAPLSGGGSLGASPITLGVSDFSAAARGTVPASGGGSANFLRADGLWTAPPAGGGTGVTDGDKGDVVVSGSGAIWMLDATVVTPAAKTVLDDISTTAMRTTLGLGNVDDTSDAGKPVSTAQAAADALRVLKSGDTMTGRLTANGGITIGLFADDPNATPEVWIYRNVYFEGGGRIEFNSAPAVYFSTSPVTFYNSPVNMTGTSTLSLNAEPTQASHAATKQYVDAKVTNVQGVAGIWTGTQAAYDAIGTKSTTTLYVIT